MNKKRRRGWIFQPVLIEVLIHLRTLETEEFPFYQLQDFFWSGLGLIFEPNYLFFMDIIDNIYFDVFNHRGRFNRKFWNILDLIARIKIKEVELNRTEEKLQKFFPRNIWAILEKHSLNTVQDFIDSEDLYSLIRSSGKDISSFHAGFQDLYDHLYILSYPIRKERVAKCFQLTQVQKISRLKKMKDIFEFDTFQIDKFFGWDVSRRLTEAGFKTLKDLIFLDEKGLIDFEEIDTLFPQKHRREFHLKFSRIYYCFSFLEEMKKRI